MPFSQTGTDYYNVATVEAEAGSKFASYCLLTTDKITADSSWYKFPLKKDSNFKKTSDKPETQDEEGNVYALKGGKKGGDVDFTFIQQNAAAKNIGKDLDGKTICIVNEACKYTISGKKQYEIAPNAMCFDELDSKHPGLEFKFSPKLSPTPALMTVNMATATVGFNNVSTCTTLSIPAGTLFLLYEE
jgi:hypothetical protein